MLLYIGTSFGTVLRFMLSSNDTMKVTKLPQLSLDGSNNRTVNGLDMSFNRQLVCGDGMGVITVWSHPEQSTTVQEQYDCGKGLVLSDHYHNHCMGQLVMLLKWCTVEWYGWGCWACSPASFCVIRSKCTLIKFTNRNNSCWSHLISWLV